MERGRSAWLKTTCRQGTLLLTPERLELRPRLGVGDPGWAVALAVIATAEVNYRSEFGWDFSIHTLDGRVLRVDWVPAHQAERLLSWIDSQPVKPLVGWTDVFVPANDTHATQGPVLDGLWRADVVETADITATLSERTRGVVAAAAAWWRASVLREADRGVLAALAAAALVALALFIFAGSGAGAGTIRLLALLLGMVAYGAGVASRWGTRTAHEVSWRQMLAEVRVDARRVQAASVVWAERLATRASWGWAGLTISLENWREALRRRDRPAHARSWLVPFGTGAGAFLLVCSLCALCALTAQGLLAGGAVPSVSPRDDQLAQLVGPILPTATPGPKATATPQPTATTTPLPTPVPRPTAAPPPPAPSLRILFTCASAVDLGTGRVCVHTLPGAALTIQIVYACGQTATNKSLLGVKHANGGGDYEWDWRPQTTCLGPATATVVAQWQDQTAQSSIRFDVLPPTR